MISKINKFSAALLVIAVVQINASGHYLQHPLVAASHAYPFASAPVFAPALASAFAAPVPAIAHALPALAPAVPGIVPAAPAVVGFKHSIPYAVPPFASQINIFKKYLTPIVPAPIIAAPHFAHIPAPVIPAPHFAPAPILGAPILNTHLASHDLPLAFGK